jgi:hypothetical protein
VYAAVKDSDTITIQNSNVSRAILREVIEVDAPVFIFEEAVALADAFTVILP